MRELPYEDDQTVDPPGPGRFRLISSGPFPGSIGYLKAGRYLIGVRGWCNDADVATCS